MQRLAQVVAGRGEEKILFLQCGFGQFLGRAKLLCQLLAALLDLNLLNRISMGRERMAVDDQAVDQAQWNDCLPKIREAPECCQQDEVPAGRKKT